MAYGGDSWSDDEKVAVWDLRQTYAEIISIILKQILMTRQQRQYVKWFELLDDLYLEINQKLKPKERKLYQIKLSKTKNVIKENENAYRGVSQDADENQNVRVALMKLEMFLKLLMEKHKLFGAKEEVELI